MQRHKAAFMCAGLYLLFGSNIFQKMCPLPDTGFICDRGISKFKKKKKKAYHPSFHCAEKSNKLNPCGHSML